MSGAELSLALAPGRPKPLRDLALRLLSRPAVFGGLMPVVTVLNALVGMALPRLMSPYAFGTYALAVTLFQYGLIFDLGGSQLMDRLIPASLGAGQKAEAERIGQQLLWLRLAVGGLTLCFAGPALFGLAAAGVLPFSPRLGLLSAFAGIAYMVALGPACLYRANSARRNYALSVVVLSSGLVFARPGGLLVGGMTGCFVALAAWYAGFGVVFHTLLPPRRGLQPGLRQGMALLARGLPFFAASFIWAFYVTGNRWFASALIPRGQFGEFAFAANIFSLLVGSASGFSALYYPRLSEAIARFGREAMSPRLRRDCMLLVLGLTVLMAAGIVLAGVLIGLIYPHYRLGVPAVRIMLVAVPALVLASWLMPVSLSNGQRPWIDGFVVFPLATLLLGLTEQGLFAIAGVAGAAAASTVAALPLVAMQLGVLRHAGILGTRDTWSLFGVTLLSCAGLALLVLMVGK